MPGDTGPDVLVLSNGAFLEEHLVGPGDLQDIGGGVLKYGTLFLFRGLVLVTTLYAKVNGFTNNLFWSGSVLKKILMFGIA